MTPVFCRDPVVLKAGDLGVVIIYTLLISLLLFDHSPMVFVIRYCSFGDVIVGIVVVGYC